MNSQHLIALGKAIVAMEKFVNQKLDKPFAKLSIKEKKLAKLSKEVVEDIEEAIGDYIDLLQPKVNRAFDEVIKAQSEVQEAIEAYRPWEKVLNAFRSLAVEMISEKETGN